MFIKGQISCAPGQRQHFLVARDLGQGGKYGVCGNGQGRRPRHRILLFDVLPRQLGNVFSLLQAQARE